MELNLSCQQHYNLKKHLFNLKTCRNDGLILQVHHSYSDSGGESKRYRFLYASFNNPGTHLAVSDHKGHIFIINLEMERYWQLPHVGLPTVISFPVFKEQELLVGLDDTSILFVHIETGNITGALQGHSVPASEVSYTDDGFYYLTSCSIEAIVWDSSTCNQIHRLSLKQEVFLKKVLFMPVTNHILACFQDNTMHIWKFGSFECFKQIVPEAWKTHHLKTIAITKNGRAMVVGGLSSCLVVFCLDTWTVTKVVEFPEQISGVKQIEFLSQVFDGGANKILVVLSMAQDLFFFDIEALIFIKWMQQINRLTAKFTLSCNGKYLASILTSGEVNIYLTERILWNKKHKAGLGESCISNRNSGSRNYSSNSKKSQRTYESLSSIQKEIKEILDVNKLLRILKQFGEYPQLYRTVIWKAILKLPENQESYASLCVKKCHPSYSKLELKYPLANKSLCNSLKKLLSNLSYWCPLFGEVDFLPRFVFPFVKLFHSNPLICFEVVATVIVNWCQNWFEFYPFPPINLLSLLESILGYHDPDLLEFYLMKDITSSISICPLFHTAFSEVLSKSEWLKLWDHILSNEPSYLFMAIVAYNVVCHNALKSLQNATEIETFFHSQNSVDIKMLISKAYQYLKETPENIHTRQFFTPFRSLGFGGTYNTFLAYPKLIIDASSEKLQTLRKEETVLDEEFKALSIRKALDDKLQQNNTIGVKEKIYEELEEKIRKTVEEEEDRLLVERQKLQNLRQELKLKELEILENTRDRALNEKIRRKELEFERLLKDISKKKLRDKLELDNIEKEIRSYYSDLLLRKCQLEMELGLNKNENIISDSLERQREKLRNDLTELQYEWEDSYHSKRIDLCNKIFTIKGLICDNETDMAKQITKKNFEKKLKDDRTSLEELKAKVHLLEEEVENLLRENLNSLQNKKIQQKPLTLRFPTKTENLRKLEKKTSSGKHEAKITGVTQTRKTGKFATKKISGNRSSIKKLTSPRNRYSQSKLRKSSTEKQDTESPLEDSQSFMKAASSKLISANPKSPQRRSKFTQPAEPPFYRPDSPENSEDFHQRSNADICDVKFCRQPQGDSWNDMKGLMIIRKSTKNDKKGSESNTKIKKERLQSDSIDDILKSALKVRSQIINDAKSQQKFP